MRYFVFEIVYNSNLPSSWYIVTAKDENEAYDKAEDAFCTADEIIYCEEVDELEAESELWDDYII